MRSSRRRHRLEFGSYPVFERPGGPLVVGPKSEDLPRAQERVQQAIEDDALLGGMGGLPPITGRVWEPVKARWSSSWRPSASGLKRYGRLRVLEIRAPVRTLFCVRRKVRREVLFARAIAGRRGLRGRGGSYRRNQNSVWRC